MLTIATGLSEHTSYGLDFIEAVEELKKTKGPRATFTKAVKVFCEFREWQLARHAKVEAAKAEYEKDKYAASTKAPRDSRLRWWARRAAAFGVAPYPLSVPLLAHAATQRDDAPAIRY